MALALKSIRVLRFILEYQDRNGYAPSQREIGAEVGCTDRGASYHVGRLAAAGFVRKDKHIARGIQIIDYRRAVVAIEDSRRAVRRETRRVLSGQKR